MKKIYDFVYSPGPLEPSVVWYSIKVGQSQRDKKALAYVQGVTTGNIAFLFAKHTPELATFKYDVAKSLFPQKKGNELRALCYLRQIMIEICQLANWLKSKPHKFLNAPVIAGELRSPFLPAWLK